MANQDIMCVICHDTPPNHPVSPDCCNHVFCNDCLRDLASNTSKQKVIEPDKCTICNEVRLHGKISLPCPVCRREFIYKDHIKSVPALIHTIAILILATVATSVLISALMLLKRIGPLVFLCGTGIVMLYCASIFLYQDFFLYRCCICRTILLVFLSFVAFMSTTVFML